MEAARLPVLLGELFLAKGLITAEELDEALEEQKQSGARLGAILVKKGFVSPPDLTTALGEQLGWDLEMQSGFGSGLWSQIKRRHPRSRESDADLQVVDEGEELQPGEERLVPLELPAYERLVVAPQQPPAVEAVQQPPQLEASADELVEERRPHDETRQLLAEARADADALRAALEESQELQAGSAALEQELAQARADADALRAAMDESHEAQAAAAALEQEIAETRAEAARHEDLAAELGERLAAAEAELSERLAAAEAVEHTAVDGEELETLRSALAESEQARDQAAEGRARAEQGLTQLEAERASLADALEQQRAQHDETRRQLDDVCARADALLADVDAGGRSAARAGELEQELAASRAEAAKLEQLETELRGQLEAAEAELAASEASRAGGDEALETVRVALADAERARKREVEALAEAEQRIARMDAERESLAEAIGRERGGHVAARRELERLQAEIAERDRGRHDVVEGHLLFWPAAGKYAMEMRQGPTPAVGGEAEIDGQIYRVTKVGCSPLPSDRRRCAYLEAA